MSGGESSGKGLDVTSRGLQSRRARRNKLLQNHPAVLAMCIAKTASISDFAAGEGRFEVQPGAFQTLGRLDRGLRPLRNLHVIAYSGRSGLSRPRTANASLCCWWDSNVLNKELKNTTSVLSVPFCSDHAVA